MDAAVGAAGSSPIAVTGAGGDTPVVWEQGGNIAVTRTNLDPDACAQGDIVITRRTPMVMFVVDRSNSTSAVYGNADPDAGPVITRWQALHDAIMEPTNGVIAKTQSEIYIGITLYDSGNLQDAFGGRANPLMCALDPTIPGCQPDSGPKCPRLLTVPPAKNSFNDIAAIYTEANAGPGGLTPTALALAEAYAQLEAQVSGQLDKKANLTPVVILVTDGEPNSCTMEMVQNPNGGPPGIKPDYEGPVAQVTAAAKKGIKTFVIGIDTSTAGSPAEVGPHLDQLAKIGSNTKAFLPANKDELSTVLVDLMGKVNCDVVLNGEIVQGYETKGTVSLNSVALEVNGQDGYLVTLPNRISLQGKACDTFSKSEQALLSAKFPCEAIVLN